MTPPTPAEKAVIDEIMLIGTGCKNDWKTWKNFDPERQSVWLNIARWHLNKMLDENAHNCGEFYYREKVAMKTLRQIAALPRGGRAKRLARAALRFLEHVR